MLVRNITHVLNNVAIFEGYRRSKNPDEKEYHKKFLKRGHNFVVVKMGNKHIFTPSRFVGYIDNGMIKHEDNPYKDGRHTDVRLRKIMGKQKFNASIEKAFLEACKELNTKPDNRKRKYWVIELPNLKWFG